MDAYERWRRMLAGACLAFAGLGLVLAVAGSTSIFAMWNEPAIPLFFGEVPPPEGFFQFRGFTYGILGGSIAGKWVATWWLVREPLKRRERWAWYAALTGLLSWFLVDSAVSVSTGAMFNVWMINLLPLAMVGPLLFAMRSGLNSSEKPVFPISKSLLVIMCWAFAFGGLVVATLVTSPLFVTYTHSISNTFFTGGELSPEIRHFQQFVFGPIGGTFLAHFLILAFVAHHAGHESWARTAILTSVLAWFVIDSTCSALHGAWFNLAQANVPCLVVVLVCLGITAFYRTFSRRT